MRSLPVTRSWSGVLTASALLLAAAMAANVIYRSGLLIMELIGRDSRTATAPALGALVGQAARDGSEWTPEKGNQSVGVMFAVAAPGELGDAKFWQEIATRVHKVVPRTQMVGLCIRDGFCGTQVEGNGDGVLVLKAMDPVQMHALAIGAREGRVFLFRDARVTGSMPIDADREKFARRIILFANQRIRGGGG